MVAAATGRPLRRRRGVAFAKSADPARETGVALAALAEKSADLLERRLQSIRAEYRQRIRTLRTVADAVRTIPEPLKLAGDLFRLVVEPTHGL